MRLILLFSLFPIALALLARWWFGVRVLAIAGSRKCRCDLERWMPSPGDEAVIHRAENSASEFGRELRLKALADWRESDPRAAASRENTRRFGLAVPPLSGIVAVFAVIVGKVPFLGGLAIPVAATALAATLGLLTIPPELTAISRRARKLREDKSFPSSGDEDAVVRCAIAHAWEESLPPVLRLIHR